MTEKKKVTSTTATLDRLKNSGQLDALIRKKPAPSGAKEIALDHIETDPDQPRRSFDKEKLASLAESIKAQGVLQPITVQPPNEAGKYIIIMGERRFQASRLAGKETIPVLIKDATPDLRMAQLTENVQRDDLTVIEIVRAVSAMRESGQSRSDIAKALGWSEGEVSRFSSVLKMPDELQKLAEENVPIRSLADLYSLWKSEKAAVRDFLARTPANEINRTTVTGLRNQIETLATDGAGASIGSDQGAIFSDIAPSEIPQASPMESGDPVNAIARPTTQKGKGVVLICRVGDDVGRIDTSKVAGSAGCLVVRFENGERIEDVPLDKVELVDVVPLD